MKTLLQILFLFFTWFNLSAAPAFSKIALASYDVSFPSRKPKLYWTVQKCITSV